MAMPRLRFGARARAVGAAAFERSMAARRRGRGTASSMSPPRASRVRRRDASRVVYNTCRLRHAVLRWADNARQRNRATNAAALATMWQYGGASAVAAKANSSMPHAPMRGAERRRRHSRRHSRRVGRTA